MVACGSGLFSLLFASKGEPGAACASEKTMRATKNRVGMSSSSRRIVYFSIRRGHPSVSCLLASVYRVTFEVVR